MLSRRIVALGAGLIVLILAGLLVWRTGILSPTPAFAFDTILSILRGIVRVQPGGIGDFGLGQDGQTLKVADRLRTEADSYALVTFFDGSTTELEPETEVSINELHKPSAERPASSVLLTQWVGVTWSRVERLADPAARYEIETPSAVVLVRGTLVETQVEPDQTTIVRNVEGRVIVRAQGVEVEVPPGQQTTVEPGQPPSPPVPIPPPSNQLRIVMQSPVWARVVDALGRSAGATEPGILVNQIPGATVTDPSQEPELVVIPEPVAGRSIIVLEGKRQGSFRLVVEGFSAQNQVFSPEISGDSQPGGRWQLFLDITYQDGRLAGATLSGLAGLTGAEPGKVVKVASAVQNVPLTATAVVLSTPASARAPRVEPTKEATPSQPKPPEPSILDVLRAGERAAYKVTYRISTRFEGETVSGEQSWYFKPPKARFDFSLTEGGEAGSYSLFTLEEGVYMCISSGGETTCLTMPKDQALGLNPGAQLQEQFQSNLEQFDATYKETRQIAGQQAQCFVVKAQAGFQVGFTEGTSCYSTQGVPLLSQIKGLGIDFTMEATTFSTTVTDADFRLPAEPVAIP